VFSPTRALFAHVFRRTGYGFVMPRAIWSGAVSFGLVNVPVKLYSALSRKSVSFNQIDSNSGARVKQKRVSAETGEEVPYEQIVKGYEISPGNYVTITDDEMASLDPEAVRTIDIDEFVDLADIDPMFYDNAYYLAPESTAVKPYARLARAMEETGKVGIAHFVMRSKQYLAAIRPRDGMLVLSTMVFADELNDPSAIPEIESAESVDIPAKELKMAEQLIESLSDEFQPEKFEDTYRLAVLDLIEKTAAGEEVVAAPSAPTSDKVVDLMAALEASVAEAKKARKRHPTSSDSADAKPAKAPAKKARKRKSA
jgi:DNA end-binding protein Ku